MPTILHIETTTKACSVGLSSNGSMLALIESVDRDYSHSSKLTLFIDEVLHNANIKPADVDAVAVSRGPGSYTGLRIGVSAAKGFCYALGIPLIAIDTMKSLSILASCHIASQPGMVPAAALEALFCPMIDARRMEVYYSLFKHDYTLVQETKAEVIDKNSFLELLRDNKIFFFGDGAEKCKAVTESYNALFINDIWPSARGMIAEAEKKYMDGDFADLAYFEPFYLKDFVAGKPKVKGLHS